MAKSDGTLQSAIVSNMVKQSNGVIFCQFFNLLIFVNFAMFTFRIIRICYLNNEYF